MGFHFAILVVGKSGQGQWEMFVACHVCNSPFACKAFFFFFCVHYEIKGEGQKLCLLCGAPYDGISLAFVKY